MVADARVAHDFRVEVAHRPLQDGAGRDLAEFQAFEGGGVFREAATEAPLMKGSAAQGELIQREASR